MVSAINLDDVKLGSLHQLIRDSNSGVSAGIIRCISPASLIIHINRYFQDLKSATDLIPERYRDARSHIRNNFNLMYRSQSA
jgi:hypothetical protein